MTDEPVRPVVDIRESTPEEEEAFEALAAQRAQAPVRDSDQYVPDYKSAHEDLTNRVHTDRKEADRPAFHDPHLYMGHKKPNKTVGS